jgi:hypothetical protein
VNQKKENTSGNKSHSIANEVSQKQIGGEATFQFFDNRPEAIAQRKLQEIANNYSAQQQQPIQKKENNTGLPDNLKSGIENLSGYSMADVKVHRNSDKPAQLQAHAYAQGTDIHLGPGQEQHLPHEAWHVVQQKQGRVKPTMQLKGEVSVNDDAGLEKEADVMGEKALQMKSNAYNPLSFISPKRHSLEIVQRWSIAMIDDQRKDLKVMDKVFGQQIGIHHIISRNFIDEMLNAIQIFGGSTGIWAKEFPETIEAANEFLGALANAVKKSFGGDADKFRKQTENRPNVMFHNLPVNLVAGAEHPLGDPGTSFDPATIKDDSSPFGEEHRKLDKRSEELENMLKAYYNMRGHVFDGNDEEAAIEIKKMSTALIKAVEALTNPNLVGMNPEEWYQTPQLRWTRKQSGAYKGTNKGITEFQVERANPGAIPVVPYTINAKPLKKTTLKLEIPSAQFTHIFQRHTYAHFIFAQRKLRNTFWKPGKSMQDIEADIKRKANQLFKYLCITRFELDPDMMSGAVNTQLPGMFSIAKIKADQAGRIDDETGEFTDYIIEIETIAPEGEDVYTEAELAAINAVVP